MRSERMISGYRFFGGDVVSLESGRDVVITADIAYVPGLMTRFGHEYMQSEFRRVDDIVVDDMLGVDVQEDCYAHLSEMEQHEVHDLVEQAARDIVYALPADQQSDLDDEMEGL